VISNNANFINYRLGRKLNILLLNLWTLLNCIMTLLYCFIYGELWLQLVELCCLSEPGNVQFMIDLNKTYGAIARVWIGPYLAVILTEPKYVEVSKVVLAL
jgi:hypothetical protein